MSKKLLSLASFVLAIAAQAAEITSAQAAAATQAWLNEAPTLGRGTGARVASAETVETAAGHRLHVVKLAGGGFAVTSADDRIEPILAFLPSGGELVADNASPLWALLSGDIAARARAAGLADGTASTAASGRATRTATPASASATRAQARWAELLGRAGTASGTGALRTSRAQAAAAAPGDVRVDTFVESQWNQSTHNNAQNGLPCYNYYTPNNYVCGCVATAGAQLMRYWQWPTTSVTALTKTCKVDGASISKTMLGGTYNWSATPLVPANGATEAQRQAIGKLTYDIGVAVQMNWQSGGSSANTFALVPRLTDTFGYTNAVAAVYQNGTYPYSLDELKKVVIPNCDARAPMAMSIRYESGGKKYGHAVIVDGYGFSGTDFYMHVNFGWGGYNDAWYIPPNFGDFDTIEGFVFNVFPEAAGSILSGRVLDAGGAPIANAAVHIQSGSATVASTTSDANGIYAFIVSGGDYVVTADVLEGSVAVATAAIGVHLAATTGTLLTDNGSWYDSAASIGNSYGNDIFITDVAAVSPPAFSPESCLFYPSTNVTITCADADATIRYTLDGSAPDANSPIYSGPIFVDDTVTIRARAFASGKNPSVIVGATYTYDAAAGAPKGDYFDDPISISGASGSCVIDDNSNFTVETGEPFHTMRPYDNGYTYNYQDHTVWYTWTAPGSGNVDFSTLCEKGLGNSIMRYQTLIAAYSGDTLATATRLAFAFSPDSNYKTHLTLTVEQGVTYRIVGMVAANETDAPSGTFTLTWNGDLTVPQTETSTTPVPVPYAWLDTYYPNQAANATAYESLAVADSDGDGFTAWEEYVANTVPTDAASRLRCTISLGANGVPVIGVIPETARDGFPRILQGKAALSDTAWADLAAPSTAYRFYRVRIDLGN